MARRRREHGELEDDNDEVPGSHRESDSYAKIYRVRESDGTRPREFANELEQDRDNERQSALQREVNELREAASSREHYWPNVGRFTIPRENTVAAHLQLVNNPKLKLEFEASAYPYFDQVIVQQAHRPDIFDPAHPDYPKYKALRTNLAVLRNDIMGMYMDDGSFDPGDEVFVPLLRGTAREIGDALANDNSWFGSLFGPTLNMRLLNVEGAGAAYLYRFLEERQRGEGLFSDVMDDVRRMTGLPVRKWDLPPLQFTAFSDYGMIAPPPLDVLCMSDEDVRGYCTGCTNGLNKNQAWAEQILAQRGQEVTQHVGAA